MVLIYLDGIYRRRRALVKLQAGPRRWTDDYKPTAKEMAQVREAGKIMGRSEYMINRARMNKTRVDASIRNMNEGSIDGSDCDGIWIDEAESITEKLDDLPIGSESWYKKNPLTVDIINCISLYLGRDSTSKMPANTIRMWLEYLADKRTAAYIQASNKMAAASGKKIEWYKS